MKLVTSIQGNVAINYSSDEAIGDAATLTRDVVAFVGGRYNFSLVPQVSPGLLQPIQQIFTYQAGEIEIDERRYPISQLGTSPGNIVVMAKDTDVAEIILYRILADLEAAFGFHIAQSIRDTHYVSTVVVDFELALEEAVAGFNKILAVLGKNLFREKPFAVRRLAFGIGDSPVQTGIATTETFADMEFVIERRVGEPHSLNRYVSNAALKTRDLIRVLELIEQTLSN